MMAMVIRHIDWLVAWDAPNERHVYLRNADLAFDGDSVTGVGADLAGDFQREIDGRGRLVMPGLINVHTHPTSETMRKGVTDETLSPGFWHSSLYEYLPVFNPVDDEGRMASLKVALAELLLSGVTSVVDLSAPFDGWIDALGDSGLRAVAAPLFRAARWYTSDGHSLSYEWDEKAGREAFARACQVIELARQHPSGRLDGMLSPSQVDTCTPELLRDSHAYATERDLPWTIHAAQSLTEFYEMQRRHGVSPIQWMADLGVLDERSIIAHCIFLDHHPWLHWTTRNDMSLMSERGATVAHCPTVFSRRGIALNSMGEYLRAGINVGIGTDTYPHNMLDEMRTAANAARLVTGTVADLTYLDVFNAATIGGATALRRDDIGRLAVGAKADFVCVALDHPAMMPVREPLRSLLVVAQERAVSDVWVGGEQMVKDGELLTIDLQAESERLQRAQAAMLEAVPKMDWAGRDAQALAPMVLPTVEQLGSS
ncbi:MAG: 5-methylthioadenosine/S-adenosylhomocysteine deaminase [Gammaproteobacteria bacterium]|jgi:5-methylthioadenosine/S-adenosylhomocysteine deaminase